MNMLARQLGLSRDKLYERALRQYLFREEARITKQLNAVYADPRNRGLDPFIRLIGERMIMEENW
jgi:hypothetical protein